MSDLKNNSTDNGSEKNQDVISELESLSQKYGLNLDLNKYKAFAQEGSYSSPKNNQPAHTSKDFSAASANSYAPFRPNPQNPEGKRVIYSEAERETIAEKRRRIASQQANAGVPVASAAANRTESEAAFKKAYEQNKIKNESEKNSVRETEQVKTVNASETAPSAASNTAAVSSAATAAAKNNVRIHQHYEESGADKVKKALKAFLPWKNDPAKEILRKIVMDISAILVLICFGFFIDNYVKHHKQIENTDNLRITEADVTEDDLAARWAAIKAKYPDVDFPEGMNIKFAELYATNQDMVGYLHIDNTNIDTPVVQNKGDTTSNTTSFYLDHNFYKTYDKYGTAYLDGYNTGSSLDRNNTIYGHNMTDGLAFAQLEKYYEIDGFLDSPIIQYSTLFEDYYFKIYAVVLTNGYSTGDNGYLFNYIAAFFPTDENFQGYIDGLSERTLYFTGVDANKDDKFITLSTCSHKIKTRQMGRLAIVGRLVRDGESLDIDTSLVKENTNVRYPQVWYDEHKMTNPYKNAYRWYSQ